MTAASRPQEITDFAESIPETLRPSFRALQALIDEVAPETETSLKWGTIAYDLDGSLFALSANKKHINLYILTLGLLAEFQDELAGIPKKQVCSALHPEGRSTARALETHHDHCRRAQAESRLKDSPSRRFSSIRGVQAVSTGTSYFGIRRSRVITVKLS